MRIGESPGLTVGVKLSGVPFGTVPYADTLWRVPRVFPTGAEGVRTEVPISQAKGQSIKNMIFYISWNPFIYFRLRSFGFVSRLFISDFKGGFLWILLHY